jgi:HAD superfamily hydrolase (TIGR01509 family)
MKQYEAYLFDWDGTLADTVRLSYELYEKHCHKYGLNPTRQEIAQHFGEWTAGIYFGLPPADLDVFNFQLRKLFADFLSNPPLHPDAVLTLQTLKQRGKKIALITSSFREVIAAVVANQQLAQLFDVIITAQDVKAPKPDPEGITSTLRTFGVSGSQALMLGDTDRDILAAHNAGIDSLLFYPASHEDIYNLEYLQRANPKYTIRSWREFLDQLQ